MSGGRARTILVLLSALAAVPAGGRANEVRVAVAANFADCLETLAPGFTEISGCRLVISPGSTGRHYAQIKAGAPFDVFLAADRQRPALLEEEGLTAPGTRFTYAEGRLALWVPAAGPDEKRTVTEILQSDEYDHLAIANPRLAPYGQAAKQALKNLGLWEQVQSRLVTGQSVGQAWQFVASGNAQAGLVALPQILAVDHLRGQWWKIDPPLHEPILQQAVVLKNATNLEGALEFLEFLKGDQARMIMIRFGYLIPEN